MFYINPIISCFKMPMASFANLNNLMCEVTFAKLETKFIKL